MRRLISTSPSSRLGAQIRDLYRRDPDHAKPAIVGVDPLLATHAIHALVRQVLRRAAVSILRQLYSCTTLLFLRSGYPENKDDLWEQMLQLRDL